jgi:hypothetical protein
VCVCAAQFVKRDLSVWVVPWILPALKTRAQYKSNNHLKGGSAQPRCTLWIREAVTPNCGFWGNLDSLTYTISTALFALQLSSFQAPIASSPPRQQNYVHRLHPYRTPSARTAAMFGLSACCGLSSLSTQQETLNSRHSPTAPCSAACPCTTPVQGPLVERACDCRR